MLKAGLPVVLLTIGSTDLGVVRRQKYVFLFLDKKRVVGLKRFVQGFVCILLYQRVSKITLLYFIVATETFIGVVLSITFMVVIGAFYTVLLFIKFIFFVFTIVREFFTFTMFSLNARHIIDCVHSMVIFSVSAFCIARKSFPCIMFIFNARHIIDCVD